MSRNNSNAFYVVKFFAILTVIFAHCTYRDTPIVQSITDLIGEIGVPIFLVAAGVFFKNTEGAKIFWMKKLKGIVVPWVIFGIFTYAISCLSGSSFSLLGLFFWWIGYGTWFYFVTILLLCYLIFRAIKWNGLPYLMIGLWIVSITLQLFGINPITNLVGQYLNVFLRIGYFAIGVLLGKAEIMTFQTPKLWAKLVCTAATIGLGVLTLVVNQVLIEFIFHFSFIFAACATLFFWSQSLSECKLFQDIGKQTYLIYFLHMQLGIGTANIVFGVLPAAVLTNAILLVVKPVTILAMVYVGIWVLIKVIKLLKLEKYQWIIGLK